MTDFAEKERTVSSANNVVLNFETCVISFTQRKFKQQLLYKSTPYAGGANSYFLNQLHLRWWHKLLLYKSTP